MGPPESLKYKTESSWMNTQVVMWPMAGKIYNMKNFKKKVRLYDQVRKATDS
jgi:hypothetical protein